MEPLIQYLSIFPLIFLILYSVCEIIWSRKLSFKPGWIFFKAFLLLVGTSLGYFIIWLTNDSGEFVPGIQNEFFTLALMIFSLLSDAYVLKLIRVTWPHEIGLMLQKQNLRSLIVRLLTRIQKFILDTHFANIIAFIGLLLLLLSVLVSKTFHLGTL